MFRVIKEMEIAGAHRLELPYQSKCSNLHGHNWRIKIVCEAEDVNENGMVQDFTLIKREVSDLLDHRCLNDVVDFNPTAENIARWICGRIPGCVKVSVQESDGNTAEYEA